MAVVTYWGHMLGINIETEMRARAFDHLKRLSWRWYDKTRTGKLVARVTRDLEEIGEVAHHGPEDLFIAVMTFVGAFLLMLWIHPASPSLTVLIVPVTVWIVSRYGGRMTDTWRDDLLAARPVQRPAGGGARRHPPGAGLRQRGRTSAGSSPPTTPATARPSSTATG